MHKHIDGKTVAKNILADVSQDVAGLAASGWQPKLVAIVIGDVDAVALYVRNQRRVSEKAGIEFEERSFSGAIVLIEPWWWRGRGRWPDCATGGGLWPPHRVLRRLYHSGCSESAPNERRDWGRASGASG